MVAVTGNSMGWYSALACAGALTPMNGVRGGQHHGHPDAAKLIGGQIWSIPLWTRTGRTPPAQSHPELLAMVAEIGSTQSGHVPCACPSTLAECWCLAGMTAGLAAFEAAVPPVQGRFPMRLANHAAFIRPCRPRFAAEGARAACRRALFHQPPNCR
jgi:[acyl-carrier-protein] S-malonyltransferase